MLLLERCIQGNLWQRMLRSFFLFNRTTDNLLCDNVARSKHTGCHCLCHACWLFQRRLARQLRGRPDRPQKDRYPFWGRLGYRVYVAMRRRRMHTTFHSQAYHILSHRTEPRYANYWPHYFRCFCWDRIDHHSTLSGGNYFTVNPRSPRLCSTMVYYMGDSHPILYPVWLLLHRG